MNVFLQRQREAAQQTARDLQQTGRAMDQLHEAHVGHTSATAEVTRADECARMRGAVQAARVEDHEVARDERMAAIVHHEPRAGPATVTAIAVRRRM